MVPSFLASLLLSLAPQSAAEELGKACARTLAAKSYTFEAIVAVERPPAGAAAPRERAAKSDKEVPIVGEVQPDTPIRLKRGDLVAYLRDGHLAYRRDPKYFELFDPDVAVEIVKSKPRQGGDEKGEGGGATAPTGEGKPPSPSAPATGGAMVGGGVAPGAIRFAQVRSLLQMNGLPIPHELFAKIATAVTDVKREEKDGAISFAGALTAEAAQQLSGASRSREAPKNAENRSGETIGAASGTLRVVVGAAGVIEQFELETKVASIRGDQLRKTTVKLSAFDATAFELPDGVREVLGR